MRMTTAQLESMRRIDIANIDPTPEQIQKVSREVTGSEWKPTSQKTPSFRLR